MESGRTADARCSGALLCAAETLSNVLPGHRRATPALPSALRRCSTLHYAVALQSASAALSSALLSRHRLPSFVRGVGVAGLFARSGRRMLVSSAVVVARAPQRGVHGTYFPAGGNGGLHRR